MFNKNNSEVEILKNKIIELEKQLIEVATKSGNVIVKQLPNGIIELNGVPIDNTTEVEYYNSANATYGELTMYRIGKEVKEREIRKLIEMHTNKVDELNDELENKNEKIKILEESINKHCQCEDKLMSDNRDYIDEISALNNKISTFENNFKIEKETLIQRYEEYIKHLEEDVISWKNRYLKINNVLEDGTIITKYGKILSNEQGE